MTVQTATRNANINDLVNLLQAQQAAKIDMVIPAAALRAKDSHLIINGVDPIITEDGVTAVNGKYLPTAHCDEQIATATGIPVKYLRRLRNDAPDLYDTNVNGWLRGRSIRATDGTVRVERPADTRSFLLRAFRGQDGETGVARALLSSRYRAIDNLDVLIAALDGIRNAGVNVKIDGADLTESGGMMVRVSAPEIAALAPALLDGYRSPFSGNLGADNPTVFAGFILKNGETGDAAFTITPRVVFEVCSNGMTITKDAVRKNHIGARLDDGVVQWSSDTQRKALDLVKAQTSDAVSTFLNIDYMTQVINDVERAATAPLSAPAITVIESVASSLGYTATERDGILDHFIRSGQATTAGGVLQAVTSYSQTVEDAERADAVESTALRAMELAGAVRA